MKRFFIGMLCSALSLVFLCACVSNTSFITDYDDPLPGPGACLNFDPSQRLVSQDADGANEVRIPRRSSWMYAAQPSDALWRIGDLVAVVQVGAASGTAAGYGLPRKARHSALPDAELTLRRRKLDNVCKNIRKMDNVLMAHWLTRDLSRMVPAARVRPSRPQAPQASNRTGRRILV